MSEFAEYLPELFESMGQVRLRRMFGGHGVFLDGLMFGLVADDVLYLKTDDVNRPDYEQLDLAPFSYVKAGRAIKMSYYEAPALIYDDAEEAAIWAARAFEAARRGENRKC
ncbi:TfoX/Sxy family protein [Thiosocius teredinicola]|uniref:TfoX/Sxy family protein n=1 Tax=Thiosocius teredinicola TaxID=1973002 RepID=UPI000990AA45